MLSVFKALVDLFGYPGDEFEDWVGLIRRGRGLMTEEEYEKAENWLVLWTPTLQSHLRQMKEQVQP